MNTKTKRILIVDDEECVRKPIVLFLRSVNSEFIFVEADNGKRALDLMMNQQFDLVITDLRMPEMDGVELHAAAKSAGIEAPFAFMSGWASSEALAYATENGLFLQKPFIKFLELQSSVLLLLGLQQTNIQHKTGAVA